MKLSDFKYIVSWNCDFIGDHHLKTIDYIGNDAEQLIAEVINDEGGYGQGYVFIREEDPTCGVVGTFHEAEQLEWPEEDRYASAVMADTTIINIFDMGT